ncbi:hypothetical protein P7C70_g9082, partial [Phenoliferia sp. Uapishka_3]
MMVLFQRKIIYLPSVPPGTRNEPLDPIPHDLKGFDWEQVRVRSTAPTRWLRRDVELRGIQLRPLTVEKAGKKEMGATKAGGKQVLVVYLQGNAGTPLLRLPLFRRLLSTSTPSTPLTILAVAPRSFWLSTRSTPTQPTLLADYSSIISYAHKQYPGASIVLYGHSLGGAVVALYLARATEEERNRVRGVVLENPLPSIPYMVRALYPQKWLPYHYLGPLVFDKWDTLRALSSISTNSQPLPSSLWIRSGADEAIPNEEERGGGVEEMYEKWNGQKKWVRVEGALHDTAFLKEDWRKEMGAFW